MRARAVLTSLSQSLFGFWFGFVMISMVSPLRYQLRNGTIMPFTRAPEQ